MNEYCMIELAFDNLGEVDKVCNVLLEEKLVAGCQVVESKSIWLWHGKKEDAKEYLVFLKTKKNLAEKIYDVVRSYHSYDTFELAIFQLASPSNDYLSWINNETRGISEY